MNPEPQYMVQYFTVPLAVSTKNIFAGLSVPQNPNLGENNWSSPHQDSYCSESVSLTGPTTENLKLILQKNEYGFTPCMVCNKNNQMIGISADKHGFFNLIVFDSNCKILAAAKTNNYNLKTFGGGYFYQDNNDQTIAIHFNNTLASFPTSNVRGNNGELEELKPNWVSDDIVRLVTGKIEHNRLYSVMPVWDKETPNLYWCLLAGEYDYTSDTPKLISCAYMAVVQIVPDGNGSTKTKTTLMDKYPLEKQWNNNTFSVDKNGAYFVTNVVTNEAKYDPTTGGLCWGLRYSVKEQKITKIFSSSYENCGWLKTGQKNIGSGTTPTLLTAGNGTKCVAITDNATPQMNVVVYNRDDGTLLKQTPVFPDRRSCDEASLIGIQNRLVVENNFGHTANEGISQLVTNEPGLAMLKVTDRDSEEGEQTDVATSEILWEDNRNAFFAMTMLARESGIIFAHTADWSDDTSATQGAMYYISAIDSWNGRVIWRIPLGRGYEFCHDYGGIYFNRSVGTGKNNGIFMGTRDYLVSIQDNVSSYRQLLTSIEGKMKPIMSSNLR